MAAKVNLEFVSFGNDSKTLKVKQIEYEAICLALFSESKMNDYILLDRETAVLLVKELKKEIDKIPY